MLSSPDEHRVLVTGATGQLGTAFRAVLPEATFLTRGDLDLTDPASISSVLEAHRPSAVINCAAYTDVDLAESEEGLATIVNGDAVGVLAESCADLSVPFVTFSTDYVFDGRSVDPYVESDPVGPVGAYGRSKLLGERLALDTYPETLVIRTSWLISSTHDNFVSTMLRLARRGYAEVVDDQRGSPTIAADLAVATVAALSDDLHGIIHLANRGVTTWYGLASRAAELAGFDSAVFEPCTTADFPTEATRPAYSVLGTERDDGPVLPLWQSSLPPLVAAQMTRIADLGR